MHDNELCSTIGDRIPAGRHHAGGHDARVTHDGGLQGRTARTTVLVSGLSAPEVGGRDGAGLQEKV